MVSTDIFVSASACVCMSVIAVTPVGAVGAGTRAVGAGTSVEGAVVVAFLETVGILGNFSDRRVSV